MNISKSDIHNSFEEMYSGIKQIEFMTNTSKVCILPIHSERDSDNLTIAILDTLECSANT